MGKEITKHSTKKWGRYKVEFLSDFWNDCVHCMDVDFVYLRIIQVSQKFFLREKDFIELVQIRKIE